MNCFTCGSNHMIETTTIYVEKLENGILIVKMYLAKSVPNVGKNSFQWQL